MQQEWVPLFFGWSGLLFDLLIPFILLWRRTRLLGLLAALLFHTSNLFIFTIGIFPVLALALSLLFFDPGFPRRLATTRLQSRISGWYHKRLGSPKPTVVGLPVRPVMVLLGVYLAWQLLMPFRHWVTPGWTSWHQDGHLFAWRMMLVHKKVEMLFEARHPETGETRYAPPEDYLNVPQFIKLARNPDMILQFANYLKRLIQRNAKFTPEILVTVKVAINGREYADLVRPDRDLGKKPPFTPAHEWVIPYPRNREQ